MAIRRLSTASIKTGSKSNKMWDQDTAQGAMEPIQSFVISSPVSTITFSNIPQNYKDLRLIQSVRTTYAGYSESMIINYNGVSTGSLYSGVNIVTADIIYVGGTNNANTHIYSQVLAATAPAGAYASIVTDVFDYASTNKYKTLLSTHGAEYNLTSSGANGFYGCMFRSTNAITSITLASANGANLASGSIFTLYGLKVSG